MIQFLTKSNNIITWNGIEYEYGGYEVIDEISLHLILSGGYFCFLAAMTNINNLDCHSLEEIINALA